MVKNADRNIGLFLPCLDYFPAKVTKYLEPISFFREKFSSLRAKITHDNSNKVLFKQLYILYGKYTSR